MALPGKFSRVIDGIELEGAEFVHYSVDEVSENGDMTLVPRNVRDPWGSKEGTNVDFKRELLNFTYDKFGMEHDWVLKTNVIWKGGTGYLVPPERMEDLNYSDLNEEEFPTVGSLKALENLMGVIGSVMSGTVKKGTGAKGNDAVETGSDAIQKGKKYEEEINSPDQNIQNQSNENNSSNQSDSGNKGDDEKNTD